jgi:uncharacterized protein (UPF0332 family)
MTGRANVSETGDAFTSKAWECLAGASSELANGRYNNVANRCYYACFQAAIAALDLAGIRSPGGQAKWSHMFVQSQFSGVLINRRKLYPAELRDTLGHLMRLREQGDYKRAGVSRTQASRALTRTRAFVTAVANEGGTAV